MFGNKKRARWLAYDDIRNGKLNKNDAEIRLMLEALRAADAVHQKMSELKMVELRLPEIYEDRDFDALYLENGSSSLSFVTDFTEINLLALLDASVYGMEAFNLQFGCRGTLSQMIYGWIAKWIKQMPKKTMWEHFHMKSPYSHETFTAVDNLLALAERYAPEHRRIYDAYMNGKTRKSVYERECNVLSGHMLCELYEYYHLQLGILKLVCPDALPGSIWASGEQGDVKEYIEQSNTLRSRSKDLQKQKQTRIDYLLESTSPANICARVENYEYSLPVGYHKAEVLSSAAAGVVWDFIKEAKNSRGSGFDHIKKYARETIRDNMLAYRISQTAWSCYYAKQGIQILLEVSASVYPKLNLLSGNTESLFEMLKRKGTGEKPVLESVPGTENMIPSDFIPVLTGVLERHMDEYVLACDDEQCVDTIVAGCIKDLCEAYSLDWLQILDKHPEAREKAGL